MRTPCTPSFSHVGADVIIVTRSSKLARSTVTATRSPRAERRRRRFGFSAAQLIRKASRHSREALASFSAKCWRSSNRSWRPAIRAQRSCSSSASLPGSTRSHSPGDHRDAAAYVGRDRDEPRSRRELAAGASLDAPARRRGHPCARPVEVRVEQRMEGDRALVVGRRVRDEVDHDPGFLARVHPHDPADALLVDTAARGRREMHADRGARRVPALCEQHRVDQDVDLSALVGGERLGQLERRCLAADRLRLQARGAKLAREVVGVLDAGRVDDPGVSLKRSR